MRRFLLAASLCCVAVVVTRARRVLESRMPGRTATPIPLASASAIFLVGPVLTAKAALTL